MCVRKGVLALRKARGTGGGEPVAWVPSGRLIAVRNLQAAGDAVTPNCPECTQAIAPGDLFTLRGEELCRSCACERLAGIADAYVSLEYPRARAEDLR